ncbi:MAG: hypothetical protein EBU70_09530, partial [Actinobacteria bacterium]|nr:hypothetical protein [Actinomycetota bacterium]
MTFAVTAVGNSIADGDHGATISATAAGFVGASVAVTATDDDTPALAVSLAAGTVAEGATDPATIGTVTRNTPTAAALVVTLQSDLPGRATVPVTVTIPAGKASATFPVTVVDNALTDGAARVAVLASAAAHSGASTSLVVTDDDVVALSLSFTTRTVTEGRASPAAIGTVTRSVVSSEPFVVTLSSADPGALAVPATVTIPAHRASAQFAVNAPDDAVALGTRSVVLAARATSATGLPIEAGGATTTFTVLDNDGPRLALSAARSAVRDGTATVGTVTRNTSTDFDLVVALASGDTAEVTVPATVTIPAGATSATFEIRGVVDGVADGTRTTLLSATAAGWNPGSFSILTTDADLPDLRVTAVSVPAAGIAGEPVTISWTVINSGTVAASGTWNDRLFLSSDDQLGGDELVHTLPFSGTLAVGESVSRTATVRLPMRLGDFQVIAVTDGPAASAGAGAGLVTEGSETNNAGVSATIAISPAYRATVAAAVDVAAPGAAVPLTGTAFDPATGAPAANVPVTVRVGVRGTRRVIQTTTDASGAFAVTFQPLPHEAGQYTVCADHPAVEADAAQDAFRIYGFRADYAGYRLSVVPGSAETRTITLTNLGDLPLTGLSVAVLGAPANLTVLTSAATTIPAGASIPLEFTVAAAGPTPAAGAPVLRVSTAEGATLDFPLDVTVRPLTPRFLTSPGFLARGMVRGETTTVSFDVVNSGGATARDVSVLLPDVPWMRVGEE